MKSNLFRPRLILLRGLPGSGKTTIANLFKLQGYVHIEADHFFMRFDPVGRQYVYQYDHNQIHNAHEYCQAHTKLSLLRGEDVVVANTFTRRWELEPYLKLAADLGITPTILKCESAFQSTHGVPQEKIDAMRARWEEV